jgi:pSer/pThr/pTyr-binding forkhead associated (FHA) protein
MIECPSCKHQQFVGTLYCDECGTRLVHVSPAPATGPVEMPFPDAAPGTTYPEGPELRTGALLGLRVVGTDAVLSLLGRTNYTLGIAIEGQAVIPDIDLGPFDAYKQGVSRIHAELLLKPEGLFIIDLDSANGTVVNGNRIEAVTAVQLRHGDLIQLGGLDLQLISRYQR